VGFLSRNINCSLPSRPILCMNLSASCHSNILRTEGRSWGFKEHSGAFERNNITAQHHSEHE
jgi:hypothetical protein